MILPPSQSVLSALAVTASVCTRFYSDDGVFVAAFMTSSGTPVYHHHALTRLRTAKENEVARPPPADEKSSSWLGTFDMLDKDGSGAIDHDELKAGLVALGQPSSVGDIDALLKSEGLASLDGDVSIDRETFLRIVGGQDGEREMSRSDLHDMFRTIDLDASGYLTTAELQHFIGNLPGQSLLSDIKMSQLLSIYDDDANGRITFEEFVVIVEDLGFSVNHDDLDTDDDLINAGRDSPTMYFEPGVGAVDVSIANGRKETGDKGEKAESKLIALSSIGDEDLREALAPFDSDGSGTIDLSTVRQAAEGKVEPKLHWSENRPSVGLSDFVKSVNHIAILVSDVSRSLEFYKNVIGFEQIRRPNFDAFGAWLTMGNCELHLIKGMPVVHAGDDLVCPHISINAQNIDGVLPRLKAIGVPFRVNSSVPAGADAGTMNTNANDVMMSDSIITQFFIRDPDGYYIEVCNCEETLTKYCLGEKDELSGYEEGTKPLSLASASTTMNIMQRWMAKLEAETADTNISTERLKATDGSIKQVAALLGCEPASAVDEAMLETLINRHSIYGDVWQNEEEDDIKEVLLESGNDPKVAERIVKLREMYRGKTIYRPPVVFNSDGTKYVPKKIEKIHSTLPRA